MHNQDKLSSVDYMLTEITKRQSMKKELFNQLLKECLLIIDKLSNFTDSKSSFRPVLPEGVIGRRLSDKIDHLSNTIENLNKTIDFTSDDLEKIQKAIFLIIQHLKFHKKIYPLNEEIQTPAALDELRNVFSVISSIESNLKTSYLEECARELKKRALKTKDKLVIANLKDTFDFYINLSSYLSYESISRLKALNDEYNEILNPSFIAREYKILNDQLWKTKQNYQELLKQREKFKESAKHLTHLEKFQRKSTGYLDEIDKYEKKLETVHEDSIHEIEDLISSYQDAHKIMEDEIKRIKTFIQEEFHIADIDDYNKKSTAIQVKIANTEIEVNATEKKLHLFEKVLEDIQFIRRKLMQETAKDDEII